MEGQRFNRSDPERFWTSMKNGTASSLTVGQWAAYDFVTAKDGVTVGKPAGANRNVIAGVVTQIIPASEYGPVQVWGYRNSALCLGGDGSNTSKLTAVSPLVFNTSGFAARRYARNTTYLKADYGRRCPGWAIEPLNTAAAATQENTAAFYKVFITCL